MFTKSWNAVICYLSTHRFCSSSWSNFRMNRIASTVSLRDILAQDDGPVIICGIDSAGYEDQEPHSPPCRSRSLDNLTVMGRIASLLCQALAPSLSPMHLGIPAAAYKPHTDCTTLQNLFIILTVRVSLTSRVTIETGKKCVPRRFTRNDYTQARKMVNLDWNPD